MAKQYKFSKDGWDRDDFIYAYSNFCKTYEEFVQKENCITNKFNEETDDYDYVSILTKEKYKNGVRLSAKCSLKSGAPLITFTDDLKTNEKGKTEYGVQFEVVAYENGCNVWHVLPYPENKEHPRISTRIAKKEFPIEKDTEITIDVKVNGKTLDIDVNGEKLTAEHADIPESFYVGVTACEGKNSFYEFKIEE